MRVVLALAALELRRFLADRFNLFFVFVLPLMLVGVLGLQSAGAPAPHVAIAPAVAGTVPDALLTQLAERSEAAGLEVSDYPGRDQLEEAVSADVADLGIVVLADDPLELEVVSVGEPEQGADQVVRSVADEVALQQQRVATLIGAGVDDARAQEGADALAGWAPVPVEVLRDDPLGEELASAGRFELGASGQLLLFVFLNTLGASAAMIQARRSGAVRRALAAPVTPGQTVSGLALGRLVIALFQAGWIIGMSSLLFGVGWGSLPAVFAVVALFGLVAAGLALVIGVVVDAEGPASGVSVGAGLVLAALGGCMVPLEFFPDNLRTVAMLTPHAWGYEALAQIQRRDGGVLEVLPQLGVLAAMAVLVLGAGSLLLRRSLERSM